MGYTHYLRQKRALTADEWQRLCEEARAIISRAKQAGIELGGIMGEGGNPDVTDEDIALNGVGAESHEGFIITRTPLEPMPGREHPPEGAFSFCKTAQKPYDAVVVSLLFKAREIAPDAFTVMSDGGQEAIKLAV